MSKKNLDQNFFTLENVDLKNSQLDGSIEYQEETNNAQSFVTTLESLLFLPLSEIVEKILMAKGFVFNIENVLAVIDSYRLGIRAKNLNEAEPPFKIKKYQYILNLTIPNKNSEGKLLNTFYQEIKQYENELLQLKESNRQLSSKHKNESIRDLKQDIKKLKNENIHLREQIKNLNQKQQIIIGESKSADNMPQLLENKGEFRIALVLNNWVDQKFIQLRFDKGSFTYPLKDLDFIPNNQSQVLCFLRNKKVEKVFIFQDDYQVFDSAIVEVLHQVNKKIKVRDMHRNQFFLLDIEKDSPKYKKQDHLMLYSFNKVPIRWSHVGFNNDQNFKKHFDLQYIKEQVNKTKRESFG